MRKVELFELIRKDYEFGLSKRAIARKRGVHRRTVNQALTSALPSERKTPQRISPKLTPEIKAFVDGVLIADRKAPRKQRHTARRVWQRVQQEHGVDVAETTVRDYVRKRRRELSLPVRAYVPQHHEIGAQGEADFYEADVDFPDERRTAHVISLRSEFSGAGLHVAYPRPTQSALLDGLARGLEFQGGVFRIIRFDNLRPAVRKVLVGRRRQEQSRFVAFRSHYMFESSFTTPGKEGAHEKGGVEGEVGRFRRRWLVPVPKVASWDELNTYLRDCCIKDLDRTMEGYGATVGADADRERKFLKPLPSERFETAELSRPRVDDRGRVRVKNNYYSVPASLAGATVSVWLTPLAVDISYQGRRVATHERQHLKNAERLELDHYLELLMDKPGAFPGSLPLHQARRRGEFPPAYDELWAALKERAGDKPGTRHMIEVLLAHRRYPKDAMRAAIDQALTSGAIDHAAIELLARRIAAGGDGQPEQLSLDVGDLGRYDRPSPGIAAYDSLVTKSTRRKRRKKT